MNNVMYIMTFFTNLHPNLQAIWGKKPSISFCRGSFCLELFLDTTFVKLLLCLMLGRPSSRIWKKISTTIRSWWLILNSICYHRPLKLWKVPDSRLKSAKMTVWFSGIKNCLLPGSKANFSNNLSPGHICISFIFLLVTSTTATA